MCNCVLFDQVNLQSTMQRSRLIVLATVSAHILPNENFEKYVMYVWMFYGKAG